MTIWKYPIKITDSQTLHLPTGARLLTVQVQGGTPCIWALVEPGNPMEPVLIQVVGTGHAFSPIGRYIGTYQVSGGKLVFHVFANPSGEQVP